MLYGTRCSMGSIIDSPEYTGQDLLDAFRQLKSSLPVRPLAAPSAPRSIPDLRWVYVKVDSVKPPLHPKYQGPFEVVSQTRNTVRIRVGDDIELVNLSRVKPFRGSRPPTAASCPRRGRPPQPRSGGGL